METGKADSSFSARLWHEVKASRGCKAEQVCEKVPYDCTPLEREMPARLSGMCRAFLPEDVPLTQAQIQSAILCVQGQLPADALKSTSAEEALRVGDKHPRDGSLSAAELPGAAHALLTQSARLNQATAARVYVLLEA